MKYLLGIDLGTSATKAVLHDETGLPVSSATAEYPMDQPKNGWAEQDPDHWWEACRDALRRVIAKSGVRATDIAGIGLSGQMHGLVMLDGDGRVLRNSILWCDGRTTQECEEITRTVGEKRLIVITANPALPGFTAGKVLWVKKHEPELYKQCRHILLPKDYLRYKLCGVFATDVSDASGTNLLDVPRRRWSDEVVEALRIDPTWLPELYESSEVTGHITPQAASLTGLAEGTPVVGGAGDNAAAAVGVGVVQAGRAFTTIGTSGVIFAHSDKVVIEPEGRVHTFCAAVPGAWSVMSCTLAAGGSLQWFRNEFCEAEKQVAASMGVDPYSIMDEQAARVPIGAHRLLYLPYLMGERSPLLDSNARGVFFGLSAMHTKQDLLRAIMEGVVYSQRACLDIIRDMGIFFEKMLITGGGGRSCLWRQMIADVYGCPVAADEKGQGPAFGAAILASVGIGLYESVPEACCKMIQSGESQQPNLAHHAEYEPYYQLYKKLYPAMKSLFSRLAGL